MKKQFRALSLCLTLALCVFGSTAALAEAPAATPAPQDQRVITDVSPLEDQIRNIVGFTTSTGGPYDFEQADHRSAVQAYGAKPAEGAVALLRIYARAEDRGDASINSSGHSFLSVRNVSDHDIEVGGLRIAPDTEMTFSPRGNRWEHTGIWYNLEGYYKRYLADSYYQNIYAVQTSLDQGSWTWSTAILQSLTTGRPTSTALPLPRACGTLSAPTPFPPGSPTPRRTCGTTFWPSTAIWPHTTPRFPTTTLFITAPA